MLQRDAHAAKCCLVTHVQYVDKRVKVKFTLEWTMKAQVGSSYTFTLSLTSALDGMWVSNVTARSLNPPGKRPGTHCTGGLGGL